jgi:hypothetical protein
MDDGNDYSSFIIATFPIQQQSTQLSWCSLQQQDSTAYIAKAALMLQDSTPWIKHLSDKCYQ